MSILNRFTDWYISAKRGESYVYYTGFLCRTREVLLKTDELNLLSDRLWDMMEANKISLVQRRVERDRFEYIAQKVR